MVGHRGTKAGPFQFQLPSELRCAVRCATGRPWRRSCWRRSARLGGTSLKAAALLSALRAQIPEARPEASDLQFDEVYAAPSASALATLLSSTREASSASYLTFWTNEK
eukprot:Skav200703  [mRNA]  locus=scaffold2650:16970:18484:- [translate_table: standard]